MGRRVIDDIVMVHDKYFDVTESEEFKRNWIGVNDAIVSDAVPKTTLKKSLTNIKLSVIDIVKDNYAKINIKDDECFIETAQGSIPISKNRMIFIKAMLFTVSGNSSKEFVSACVSFTQHVFTQAVQRKEPTAILSASDNELTDLIYRELSEFYVEVCS